MEDQSKPKSKLNPQLWSRQKDKKIFGFSKKILKFLVVFVEDIISARFSARYLRDYLKSCII
ncbi:hypothetical protein KKA15_03365 [Patescibacteria group bacterium]|nr:hypothetical protein [Patescibacteria group bacterium]